MEIKYNYNLAMWVLKQTLQRESTNFGYLLTTALFNSNQGNLGKIARITGYLAKKLTCSNQGYLERKIIRIPANLGRSLLPLISHTVKHLLMIQTTHRHAILIFLICSFDGTHLCGLEWRFRTAVNYSHSLTRMCWVGGYAQSYA